MRAPCVLRGVASLLAACAATSAISVPPMLPRTVPLAFDYLRKEISRGWRMGMAEDALELLAKDAIALNTGKKGGDNYKDNKGTTWWASMKAKRRFSIEQIIDIVALRDFGPKMPKNIVGAEYWVQWKGGDDDGGFHYDKDESAASNQQRMVFPSLSTITYLSDGGAPTVIFNQTTNQYGNDEVPAMPQQGMISYPQRGKHIWFDGLAQHGVAGGGCVDRCDQKRLVLLINWWDHMPEPPNCQVLGDGIIRDLGMKKFSKAQMKGLRALKPKVIEVEEDLSPVTPGEPERMVRVELPPKDHVVFPVSVLPPLADGAEALGRQVMAHWRYGQSTMLGVLDPYKNNQNAHIKYSEIPIVYVFVGGEQQQSEAEAVMRPLQLAIWSSGEARQYVEMYVCQYDVSQDKMAQLGVGRSKKGRPVVVFHKPGQQSDVVKRMKGAFGMGAVATFLRAQVPQMPELALSGSDLPGRNAALDKLSARFVGGDAAARDEAAALVQPAGAQKKDKNAEFYVKIMDRIVERGADYPKTERARIAKVLKTSLTEAKRTSMLKRSNILLAFLEAPAATAPAPVRTPPKDQPGTYAGGSGAPKVRAALRTELEGMRKGALRRRCVERAGIDADTMEKADDAQDTKAAFIELLLRHHDGKQEL